jgi:hypothetical protein
VRAACADYLAAVELLSGRRASLVAALEQQVPACSHAPVIARLRCFRGIDTLSAAGLCAELGDWRRFPKPARVSGFVGIVPSEHTSDSKRRQGAITKAGPGHARRLLVEAAQHYRTAPRIGPTLARRQAGQDPRVIAIAWRAQRRLHQRWQHLHHTRRKPSGVVAIASHASSPRSAGRPPRLTDHTPTTAPGTLPGAHEHPGRPSTVARGPRTTLRATGTAGRARSQTASRDEHRVLRSSPRISV